MMPQGRTRAISIHAPRTGSDQALDVIHAVLRISIHAPRTGSDSCKGDSSQRQLFQSTLPARGATLRVPSFLLTQPFQSTLPARGATLQRQHIAAGIPHFNPRSPHGERPCSARRCGLLRPISIHAPRTGSDGICIVFSFRQYGRISIHAPRTGSDGISLESASELFQFQSTLPARGATATFLPETRIWKFQSTLPARGATRSPKPATGSFPISIHAPRTGSDIYQ